MGMYTGVWGRIGVYGDVLEYMVLCRGVWCCIRGVW